MKKEAKQAAHIAAMNEESEKSIERYLVEEAKKRGWETIKMDGRSQAGCPDRLILCPGHQCFWIELKSKGGYVSALQSERIKRLRQSGQMVFLDSSKRDVDTTLNFIALMIE